MQLILEVPDTFDDISIKAQEVVKKRAQDLLEDELKKLQLIEDEKVPDEKSFNDSVRSPEMRQKLNNISSLLKKKGI